MPGGSTITTGWRACGWSARTCRRRDNAVTLHASEKDQYGLPVPDVHYDDHANDKAMRDHAYGRGEEVYKSAGAVKAFRTPPYPSTHNLGTNRMSEKPQDGVVQ